jgi:hypothetical protein
MCTFMNHDPSKRAFGFEVERTEQMYLSRCLTSWVKVPTSKDVLIPSSDVSTPESHLQIELYVGAP